MADGFYLLHRGWQDHPIFKNEPFSRRDAFVWLLEEAAFRERRVSLPQGEIILYRGQLTASTRYMAKAWRWDEAKVRRYCVGLSKAKIIDAATDAGQTIITICNYEKYQTIQRDGDAPDDAASTQHRRSIDANKKELKEGNELKSEAKASQRKRALVVGKPDDVSIEVWQDFETHRRRKGSPITKTVLDGIRREAGKVNWSMDAALAECCVRGWQGFKADWVQEAGNGRGQGANAVGRNQSSDGIGKTGRAALAVAEQLRRAGRIQ